MKKFLLFFATMLIAATALAQQISPEKAMANVREFLSATKADNSGQMKKMASGEFSLAYTSSGIEGAYFYVFNNSKGGYVVAGADENAREILGYSENGTFDYNNIPDNMKWWLGQYSQQIAAAIKYDAARKAKANPMPKKAGEPKTDVSPLVSAQWGQGAPYNLKCPDNGMSGSEYKQTVTGCVATAMSQVMYTYKWPNVGVGSNTYTSTTYNFNLTSDFKNHTYDWGNMHDNTTDNNASTASKNAVSQLCFDAGVSVNMNYGYATTGYDDGGSLATSSKIPLALGKYFKYDKGEITQLYRQLYTDNEWEDIVYAELKAERPVLYGGTDAGGKGGHEFICDGYKVAGNLYHFNWGWNGYCDNYYAITGTPAINPSPNDVHYQFTSEQDIVIGVMKDKGGTWHSNIVAYKGGNFTVKENHYPNYIVYWFGEGKGLHNVTDAPVSTELGAQFVNQYTGDIYNAYDYYSYEIPEKCWGTGWIEMAGYIDDEKVGTGVYEIKPIYADTGDKENPKLIRTYPTNDNTATLVIKDEASFYDLKIGESGVASLYLPYDAIVPSEVTLWYIKNGDLNSGYAKLTQYTGAIIPANTGFIVKGTANTVYKFKKNTSTVAGIADNKLSGCDDFKSPEGGVVTYILANKEKGVGFYKFNGDKLNPFRAYFTTPSSAKENFELDFGGESTGINTVGNSQSTMQNSQSYNLQGVKVNDSYKGIIISNGKKHISR